MKRIFIVIRGVLLLMQQAATTVVSNSDTNEIANALGSAFFTSLSAVPLLAAGRMLGSGLFGLMRQRRQKAPVKRHVKLTLWPSLG